MKRLTAATVLLIIVALSAVLAGGCSKGTKAIVLRYKFIQGTTTVYESTYKGSTKIFIGDSVIVNKTNQVDSRNVVFTQQMVDDTTADLLETRSLRFHMVNKLDSTIIDTNMNEEPVVMRVTTRGRVLLAGSPKNLMKQISAQTGNTYNQELPVFPAELISRGQAWTQETTIRDGNRALKTTTTYKIESFVRERGYDCVTVSYEGFAILPPKESETNGRYVTNKLSVNGIMYFAYTEGFVVSQRERRVVEGDGYQSGREAKRIPVQVSVEYDIELKLAKPPTATD